MCRNAIKEIAAQFDVKERKIRDTLKQIDPKTEKEFTPEQDALLIKKYQEGSGR